MKQQNQCLGSWLSDLCYHLEQQKALHMILASLLNFPPRTVTEKWAHLYWLFSWYSFWAAAPLQPLRSRLLAAEAWQACDFHIIPLCVASSLLCYRVGQHAEPQLESQCQSCKHYVCLGVNEPPTKTKNCEDSVGQMFLQPACARIQAWSTAISTKSTINCMLSRELVSSSNTRQIYLYTSTLTPRFKNGFNTVRSHYVYCHGGLRFSCYLHW